MNGIWIIEDLRSSTNRLFSISERGEMVGHIDFLNERELHAAGDFKGRPRRRPFPVAQLKITRTDFDADFFRWSKFILVSERMREVMTLDSADVRLFDVDASQSAPLPRSKNYQILEPTVVEDVSDPEKSSYGVLPSEPSVYLQKLMDGIIGSPIKSGSRAEFVNLVKSGYERLKAELDFEFDHIEAHSIVMRADAAPAHELFYDGFFRSRLMCTEAFALRVLKAGCTGVKFVDPSRLEVGQNRRYRTLRGIEEDVAWDVENRVEITKLIQPID